MRRAVLLLVLAASATVGVLTARADSKGESVDYKHGDVALEGYLALPAGGKAKAGVLIVHEWWGLTEHAKHTADELAKLGYAAFALDMFGKGVHTDDPKEAGALTGKLKADPKLWRERAAAGLEALRSCKAKPEMFVAIGYCFGGTTALELARSGADLKGVVGFHCGLGTANAEDAKKIKGKVLVCEGGDDTFVSAKEIEGFETEMRNAGVDWQLVKYGGAVHSFTNPDADKHKIPGIAYNEKADKRSWKAMESFLQEVFAGH